MADSKVASAATALDNEIKTAIANKFFVRAAMELLSHIACQPPEGPWDWDARQYPLKRGMNTPNLAALNNHSQVLLELIRLVPNANPIHSRLRNGFMTLHKFLKIFSMPWPWHGRDGPRKRMAPSDRALMAATR